MRACYCLNILINTEEDLKEIKIESLNLTPEEKIHAFFEQEFFLLNKLGGIQKTHSGLVRVKQVGSWIIHDCLNCAVHTHAIHKELGESFVLIYAKLLGPKVINNIKASDNYSPIFGIVVDPNGVGLELPSDPPSFPKSPPVEITETVKQFEKIAKSYVIKEYSAMEERIKNYQMQEMKKFEMIKEKSHREHESLIKVLLNALENDPSLTNRGQIRIKTFADPGLDYGGIPAELFELSSRAGLSNNETKRQKGSLGKRIKKRKPTNDDLLFFYEDVPESESLTDSSESSENLGSEDEDSKISKPVTDFAFDSEEEQAQNQARGVSINQQKKQLSVAKSLPININFTSQLAARLQSEEDFDNVPAGEDVDIAASIKALAKSVHGDTIFGELPKPRFSTQI